eukprot:TRINITY_DN4473_c0_g1_i1.p1 TRINITY_DN4473_c0_g1~~TRINITY_DN4473_c0_g1_i1.p1  ORF type:complete len:132 (-),score=42.89 TRINITY_DN4473_c0_g1_i1:538-933(-)
MNEYEDFLKWKQIRDMKIKEKNPTMVASSRCRAVVKVDDEDFEDSKRELEKSLCLRGDAVLNPTRYLRHVKELVKGNNFGDAHKYLNQCEDVLVEREQRENFGNRPKMTNSHFRKTLIWKAARAARYKLTL